MAKKKNKMRADGRIAVQVYLGEVDGRRKYKTVYGKTQKEADEKALQVKLLLKRGIDVGSQGDTFGRWAAAWLLIKESEVSYGRLVSYRCHAAKFKELENVEITRLKTADFQKIVLDLAQRNPKTGRPTAHKTLLGVKSTAFQICRLAVENRVMDYNPVDAVKIPPNSSCETRRALDEVEQSWIVTMPHRAQIAAMIMMYAGLRRGEMIPLTWNDINLVEK